jgi:hypothetical protein
MTMHVTNHQKFYMALFAMMLWSAPIQAQMLSGDVGLAEDLRTVIILAGYPCKQVSAHSQSDQSEYRVSCDVDRHYRVSISEEKRIVVEAQSGPAMEAVPGSAAHEEFMKRQLFAIVNLTGHDCEGVLSYERIGPKGHTVICEDQTVYRIHVTPEGRVAVEKQPIEK